MAVATSIPPARSPRTPRPPHPPTPPTTPMTPTTPTSLVAPKAPPHWQQRDHPQLPRGLRGLTRLRRYLPQHLPQRLLALWRSHPLWRNTDYLLLLAGQAVSVAGSGASTLALPLLVLWLTHSPVQAGLLGAVRLIPYALLALPAGAWVDRCNRKRLMITCDLGRAVLMGSIPLVVLLTGQLWLPQLYLVSLGEGALFVFFDVAETASTVTVVGTEQLPTAIALSTIVANSAQLLGPLVGGALYAVGRLLPLAVDALSYGVSLLSLTQMRAPFQTRQALPPSHTLGAASTPASTPTPAPSSPPRRAAVFHTRSDEGIGPATTRRVRAPARSRAPRLPVTPQRVSGRWGIFWAEARVGVTLVWGHPTLRLLLLLGAVWNTVVTGFTLLVIVRAQALHASAPTIGLILAAAGAGSVIGPVVGAPLTKRLGLAGVALGGAVGEAILWPLLGWVGAPLALAGVVALLMASDQAFNVAQYTWRLSLLPTAALGRTTATFRLALLGTQPVGLALMGLLLTRWGAAPTALWCGAALLGATGVLGWQVVAPLKHGKHAGRSQQTPGTTLAAMRHTQQTAPVTPHVLQRAPRPSPSQVFQSKTPSKTPSKTTLSRRHRARQPGVTIGRWV